MKKVAIAAPMNFCKAGGRIMDELRIEYIDIDKITPYENNARKHQKADVDAIKKSIEAFGMNDPIGVWSDKNIIVEGHGRLLALKELGYKKVPCIRLDRLTDEQRKAYALAHNKTAELSEWDFEKLKEELDGISLDMGDFGFEDFTLEDLENVKEDEFDIDAELQKPSFSKKGDIWCLGRHKVICGDSTIEDTFARVLEGNKANLVVTDAPYFVDLDSASGKISNDNLKGKEAYEFLFKAFTNLKDIMKEDASIYEFYATSQSRIFYDAFEDAGFKLGASLVWRKDHTPLMRTDWKFNFEPVIFGWRKDGKHRWYGDQKQKACFDFASIRNSTTEGWNHPSSKPVPLIAYLIAQSSKPNDLVFDAFLGSASTLIACEQTNRTCYGIELEEKFVDVAVKRYIAQVGKSDEVYVIRDGEKIKYKDLNIEENDTGASAPF